MRPKLRGFWLFAPVGLPPTEHVCFFLDTLLHQNSMRTENSAIPCRDDCPIQVLPHPASAKILSRTTARAVYLCIFATLRWFGLGSPIVPGVQLSQSHMRKDATSLSPLDALGIV